MIFIGLDVCIKYLRYHAYGKCLYSTCVTYGGYSNSLKLASVYVQAVVDEKR